MDRQQFIKTLRHGNLGFDVMMCAAIGASAVSLFFFFTDAMAGRGLYTPMLMGSVLFQGAEAESVKGLDIQIVAAFTLVHLATFAVVGFAASLLAPERLSTRSSRVAASPGLPRSRSRIRCRIPGPPANGSW